jgi:hypothetical protein
MLRINPEMKFLLTVSPVPLAATATKEHVLTATTYSKSILRAVAGELAARFEDVDYFPSYELISSPFSREFLYEEDLREVRADALDAVMRSFLRAHAPNVRIKHQKNFSEHNTEVICEERLLDAFSWRRSA